MLLNLMKLNISFDTIYLKFYFQTSFYACSKDFLLLNFNIQSKNLFTFITWFIESIGNALIFFHSLNNNVSSSIASAPYLIIKSLEVPRFEHTISSGVLCWVAVVVLGLGRIGLLSKGPGSILATPNFFPDEQLFLNLFDVLLSEK